MAVALVALLFLLSVAGFSSAANYCLCKDGLSEAALQRDIDYACGAGADCSQISQGGSCFNPNTVKDHCNYAVNSYFQKKGQVTGSCDFSGTATVTSNPPASNGCTFPSSGSGGTTPTTPGTGTPGTGTPSTGTPGTGTPSTGTPGTPPGTGTPGTGTPGTGTPGTGTPGTGSPGTGTPSTGTPSTGTPGTPGTPGAGTPGTGTPGAGTPGTGTPSTGTPSTGTPGTGTPSTGTPGFGTPGTGTGTTVPGSSPFPNLAPTGVSNPDSSGSKGLESTHIFYSLTILFYGFQCLKL